MPWNKVKTFLNHLNIATICILTMIMPTQIVLKEMSLIEMSRDSVTG